MSMGMKSFSALLAFIFFSSFSYFSQSLSLYYVKQLSGDVLFFNSLVSYFLCEAFFLYWKLSKKSKTKLSFGEKASDDVEDLKLFSLGDRSLFLGENDRWNAYELPRCALKFIYFFSFFVLCLLSINNRGFSLLKNYSKKLEIFSTKYCHEKKSEVKDSKEEKMGCELVKRAYKMGYAKSLGDCADRKIDPRDLILCEKRRIDEPWLHFLGRSLSKSLGGTIHALSKDSLEKSQQKFKKQYNQLDVLTDYQSFALTSAPRSSHHLFTNLKYPGTKIDEFLKTTFNKNDCLLKNKKRSLNQFLPTSHPKSEMLEHVAQNLLFNAKVRPSKGYCREFHIHWETESNICKQLSLNPEQVLEKYSAWESVSTLLRRSDNSERIRKLKNKMKSKKKRTRLSNSLSFSCFIEKEKVNKRKISTYKLKLQGHTLFARNVQYSLKGKKHAVEVEMYMYMNMAKVFKKNFNYNLFQSKSQINSHLSMNEIIDKFEDKRFLLTKLDYLNSYDVFLGDEWAENFNRVYPQHVHLKNYLEFFRTYRQYLQGRL